MGLMFLLSKYSTISLPLPVRVLSLQNLVLSSIHTIVFFKNGSMILNSSK